MARRSQSRPSRHPRKTEPFAPDEERKESLVLADTQRLQSAAWAEFHSARKRLEKVSRDLHRHEEVDTPAYEKWIHQQFPTWITRLRQLHEEVFRKGQKVHEVQALSMMTGRSPKKIWKELRAKEANPRAFAEEEKEKESDESKTERDESDDDDFEEDDLPKKKSRKRISSAQENDEDDLPDFDSKSTDAKSIYRRLVQRLHPDRGGEWSAARKRLWNEVQLAWDARDADWLARLEVEWETNNDVLGPASPLGRLREAIIQLDQARRDVERKLRAYRKMFSWRFTLSEKKRDALHRTAEQNFKHDFEFMQHQLNYLNDTIAAWERPAGIARAAEVDEEPGDKLRRRRRW